MEFAFVLSEMELTVAAILKTALSFAATGDATFAGGERLQRELPGIEGQSLEKENDEPTLDVDNEGKGN